MIKASQYGLQEFVDTKLVYTNDEKLLIDPLKVIYYY